jgi:hypothetical protein
MCSVGLGGADAFGNQCDLRRPVSIARSGKQFEHAAAEYFCATVRHKQNDPFAAHLRLLESFEPSDPPGERAHLFLNDLTLGGLRFDALAPKSLPHSDTRLPNA